MNERVGAHLIGRCATGWGVSEHTQDRMTMTLWAHDIPTPGEFAMTPDQARALASELVDRAIEAEVG